MLCFATSSLLDFSTSRDVTWTSLTVVWADPATGRMKTTLMARTAIPQVCKILRSFVTGFRGRTEKERFRAKVPTRAIGRENRRPSRRGISTSIGRDSITALSKWMLFLCQKLGEIQHRRTPCPEPGGEAFL